LSNDIAVVLLEKIRDCKQLEVDELNKAISKIKEKLKDK